MAETLGSLCDKLTIVKLKQWHSNDQSKLISLEQQNKNLVEEIDEFLTNASGGLIPVHKLTVSANKVYNEENNKTREFSGNMGSLISSLAFVNCQIWHEQEKVFDFEKVPYSDKDGVIKLLAVFNLDRNKCIEAIDNCLISIISNRSKPD